MPIRWKLPVSTGFHRQALELGVGSRGERWKNGGGFGAVSFFFPRMPVGTVSE